jgi:Tfp pilus assembly protein PilN
MAIVHADVIKRYLDILRQAKICGFKIILSSYGLGNLHHYLCPEENLPAMVVDIDSRQVELAIVSQAKLLFSRSFKLSNTDLTQDKIFPEEIEKTGNAYRKEAPAGALKKIVIFGQRAALEGFAPALGKKMNLPVEILNYREKLNLKEEPEGSFAGLLGLGLGDTPEALNLIPPDIKEINMRISRRSAYLRSALFIIGGLLIFMLAITKSLDNKAKYLARLKSELNKIAQDAKPLEDIDRRLKLLESRLQKKPSSLDVLFETQRIAPAGISLLSLAYEEDDGVILRGQAPQLDAVLAYLAELEKSPVFEGFNIKVRYATKKNTQRGEMVEFEINCLRR